VITNCLKEQTFTAPEVKEVPVGLSDEQIDGLIQHFKDEGILQNKLNHAWVIKDYLKTQAFAIPEVQPVSALSSAYQCLLADNLALAKELKQLKAQQFTPDWSKIDDDSTIDGCKIDLVWTCCGGLIERETLTTFERPTPPAPRVEVGQVWGFHGSSVEIVMVTEFQIVMKSIETGNLSIDDIEDFLAKFERVGGSE
jgi:hypothetical protein